MRPISIPAILIAALCVLLLSGISTASLDAPEVTVRIDPTKTRVGLARVHLDVTDITLKGNELEGRYRIRVPLFPFKNDTGTIRLRSEGPIDSGHAAAGTLAGTAHSDSGIARDVLCTLGPGNSIDIGIAMEKRVVTFKTTYRRL